MWSLRSRSKKLYFGFAIIACIILIFHFTGSKYARQKIARNIKKYVNSKFDSWNNGAKPFNASVPILQPILLSLSKKIDSNAELLITLAQEAKCPACFGMELCEEISTDYVKLLNSNPVAIYNDFVVFAGTLGSVQKVSLLVPRPDILGNFDQLVCPNSKATQWGTKCKSLLDAENPFLLTPKEFINEKSINSMRDKLSLQPQSITPLTCMSANLKDLYVKTFDNNDDRRLDIEERSIFHTSLTLMPHLVNLKAVSTIGMINTFPQVVGSCGRVIVMKGEMNPLSLVLNDSFSRRASIAVQLLNWMQEFLENDDVWMLFQPFWRLDNLHVNEKGISFFSSLSDMYIIEKKSEGDESKPCTWDCVRDLRSRLHSGRNNCFNQVEAMHIMYSEVCVNILSDMKQHKFSDYFDRESNSRIEHRSWPGLLHGASSHDRGEVEKLLATCADEVKTGERMEAVEDLQDLLADIVDSSLEDNEESEEDDINEKVET